jgi:hypothetical protein
MTATDTQTDNTVRDVRRRHIIDISALTAIASLVVALIFNGLQVRDSADQARQAKLATELQLLTQLNGLVTQSEVTFNPRSSEIVRAELRNGQLSNKTNAELGMTLKNLDYLAWLVNNGFIRVAGARQLWARRMKCLYATAVRVYGPTANVRLPNLERFVSRPRGESLIALQNDTC